MPNLRGLIIAMQITIRAIDTAAGLSAPQVGVPIRLFVIKRGPNHQVFINPEVEILTGDLVPCDDGCLSIPKVHAVTQRPYRINATWYDENWKKRNGRFTGFLSHLIQHENDHLDGRLFIDLLPAKERKELIHMLSIIEQGKKKAPWPMRHNPNKIKTTHHESE